MGGALATWLLWHFAFGDSTDKSTVQAFVFLAIVLALFGYDRRAGRPPRR